MESPECTAYEGKVELKMYTGLDLLYGSILRDTFYKNDIEDDAMVRSILGAVDLVTNLISPHSIATLMGFEYDVVLSLLKSVQPLLVPHDDINLPIQSFHKSFPDFITYPTPCIDTRFYTSPDHHTGLVLHCLGLMRNILEKNMCLLPNCALNSEVDDLQRRIERSRDQQSS